MATLFNNLWEKGSSPATWGLAHVKLIYNAGDALNPLIFDQLLLDL